MFTDEPIEAWVADGLAGVSVRGLAWEITGWLGEPEISRDADEVRFAGPAAGDPGVWLELRHTIDRTWQIRLTASCADWADWPGAKVTLEHRDRVHTGLWEDEDFGIRRTGEAVPMMPVWTWSLGSEGWLMVADHFDRAVLFGALRRGIATDTVDGILVPPARIEAGRSVVTAWSVQELRGVGEVHARLPSWLPTLTATTLTDEIALSAPDHGLVPNDDVLIEEDEGVTRVSSDGVGGITEITLHGARGTTVLPLAFAPSLVELVPDVAAALVERIEAEQLSAGEALILSVGASAGVPGAAELLGELTIATTGGADQPLVVGTYAIELARTGDGEWADRLASAAEHLPAVPGAPSALLRAVVGTFAVNGDPQAYLDRIADFERAAVERYTCAQDAVFALEVAAIGGWAHDTLIERVAGQLGWGLPLSLAMLPDRIIAAQAVAAMSLVDEHLVRHWPVPPSVIAQQAARWIIARECAGEPDDLLAWLLLPVTQ